MNTESGMHDVHLSGVEAIETGRSFLGIEFGSTRIKAALIDPAGEVLAIGAHAWENQYIDDNWTYSTEAVWSGLQACYAGLAADVERRWGCRLTQVGGLGVSAMMHGYLAFDASGELLTPFRTWRNTYTTEAAGILTESFHQNVPLRWSVSHLLHAVTRNEEHVTRIDYLTTLAGYVHWRLSGRRVLGIGDASGMFPIDARTKDYDACMAAAFNDLHAVRNLPWRVEAILPEVLLAGQPAGALTEGGAALLDPSGELRSGAVMAPPEGDAGTGMVATNSVRPRTGNVSAGTSAFAMVVLETQLPGCRPEIDLVSTPAGDPAAMIHTNNCTGDLDAWLRILARFAELVGADLDTTDLYRLLYEEAVHGADDAGGLLAYNYLSGEHQTGVSSGRPLFLRATQSEFTLANFMRAQLYSAFGALALGMNVLLGEEKVELESLFAHGGIFRTAGVAQQILADAVGAPVSVGDVASEGGAWGMAVLAAFVAAGSGCGSLTDYLATRMFAGAHLMRVEPDSSGALGYAQWLSTYERGLELERRAQNVIA
ncbi:xylulokinase [Piscicoccus intestinalis]|uniref:xylulokinase n=1 Tax=Piscicoccus intestinalis TaxID=746033 RepID=UPI000A05E134|nr:FGGY-family carbohydrate kinase [Piscicoccus intestinalis]